MPVDPTPFLATEVGASVTLAAIVGGLLVARFVTIDSDQQTSQKVLTDARERLDTARTRTSSARRALLDWDADDFFSSAPVAKAVAAGLTAPRDLMRITDWEHSGDDLRPYADQVVKEHQAARAILPALITKLDKDWNDFRRQATGLPTICWPRIWREVYDEIARKRSAEEAARRAAQARASLRFDLDRIASISSITPDVSALIRSTSASDYRTTSARRRDDLVNDHQIARQQVEDYEAELRRLQAAHAEIVRPDSRLWWGIGIVVLFAVVGVALPLWVMAQGPKDLASVRWLFWPFAVALAALVAYMVVYLAQLNRSKTSADNGSSSAVTR